MEQTVLSVKQLNMYVKSLIEGDLRLANVSVKGEISNFKNHYASGHLYFSLKDKDATIRCVMFRAYAQNVKFEIEDGMEIILTGKVSLYEKDGQYQFYAEEMHNAGLGDISLKYEQIKKRLADEGLFDMKSKRPIPKFPKRIAVVTSNTGAAVQDILNILSRRYPVAEVIMCPVAVQGDSAVPDMLDALNRLYENADADLIIIGRGGGSIEDLWAFNSEELARKIYESPIPVISAVGHETDFTICDFVADLRAPTPSAAAELAVPDARQLLSFLDNSKQRMRNSLALKYQFYNSRLSAVLNSKYFKKPLDELVFNRQQILDKTTEKMNQALKEIILKRENQFSVFLSKLDALSPLKVMNRGYSIAESKDKIIKTVNDVDIGDKISIMLLDGKLNCLIENKEKLHE